VPFEGENVREVIARQMLEEPIPLSRWVPDIPPAMSRALHQALNKDPKKRFASIDAFSRSLQGEVVAPSEGGRVAPRASKFNIPHRKRQWLAAVIWILTIGGVAWASNRFEFIGAPPAPPAGPDSLRPSPAAVETERLPPERPSRPASSAPSPGRARVAAAAPRDTAVTPPVVAPATCRSAFDSADWTTAFPLCRAAADSSIPARRMVGIMYAEGKGVAEDQRQASAFLRDAAEEADLQAVWLMAQRYEAGLGTDTNPGRAAGFYLLAATLGKREAWPIVAERYAAGNGFKQNDEAAFGWWRRAADSMGHLLSMTRVAEAYSRGRGVKKDELLGQSWYFRAAEKGEPEAEYQVGMMHIRGKGVAKNPFTARGWLEKAAARGHEAARLELAKLAPPS
jgi:TPR repeat protein